MIDGGRLDAKNSPTEINGDGRLDAKNSPTEINGNIRLDVIKKHGRR